MQLRRSSIVPFGPRGVLLALEDEAGRVGVGEASPLPGYSDETLEEARNALVAIHAKVAAFRDDAPIEVAMGQAMEPVARALDPVPSARFALETALLDLVGQRSGRSIAACFGRETARVALNGLVRADAADARARAEASIRRGLGCLKIKIGGSDWARELAFLRALRAELGASIELRADANGRFDLEMARARLQALEPLALRFVEQPVPADRLETLGRCAVPWAADESLRIPGAAARLARTPGCGAFVLKPAVLGGFLAARALARLAQDAGLDVVVTHLMDGPVAIAAACELALSLDAPLACGLDLHEELAAWPTISIPQLATGVAITPSGVAGLGISFDSRVFSAAPSEP